MTYARIVNGAVAQWPYDFAQLRRDNRNVSFPRDVDDKWLAGLGVVRVGPSDPPAYDRITENLVAAAPVLAGGVWVEGWSVTPASAGEIASRQRVAADSAAHEEVRLDTFVGGFLAMTPAQVGAYIDNNTANLGTTRALLKKMAVMLLILARRELRDVE